jgi:hypothetical protein
MYMPMISPNATIISPFFLWLVLYHFPLEAINWSQIPMSRSRQDHPRTHTAMRNLGKVGPTGKLSAAMTRMDFLDDAGSHCTKEGCHGGKTVFCLARNSETNQGQF